MAETKQDEQLAEPQEILEGTPDALPQESSEDSPQKVPKAPKQRDILLPVLTVLLILVGIGEAVFWGYYGFSAYARSLARERYEQQQKAEDQPTKGLGGSSYSPNLKVENGTVIWEREKWGYSGGGQPANTSTGPRREDGMRLSRLPAVKIHYALAEMDTDWEPSSAQTEESAPAST